MDQVKTYKINGYLKKRGTKISFTKDVKAFKESDALEKIYCEMGSRHKAKRFDIKVTGLEEIKEAGEPK